MRKLVLACLLFFAASSFAQVPKTVLVEHFTNSYCSVCASRNPGLFANLANFPNALHLSYHPSSPYKQCPLNQYDKEGNDGRTNHYSIYGSTPRVVANGVPLSPQTSLASSQFIDDIKNEMSDYSIEVNWSQIGPTDSIRIDVRVKLESANSQTKGQLFVGLFQDTVYMISQNGEENPPHVYRGGPLGLKLINLPTTLGSTEITRIMMAPLSGLEDVPLYAAAIVTNGMGEYEQSARSASHSSLPTLLKEHSEQAFTLYPNPSNGAVFHSLDADIAVRIMDYTGKSYFEGLWMRSTALPSKLKAGIYLIEVEYQGVIGTQRLVLYP